MLAKNPIVDAPCVNQTTATLAKVYLDIPEYQYVDLVYDDHHGVYIPQLFAKEVTHWEEAYHMSYWLMKRGPYPDKELYYYADKTFTADEVRDLYWECFSEIVDNVSVLDEKGRIWRMIHSGSLWLVASDCPEDTLNELLEI